MDEHRIQRPERSKLYGYHVSNSEVIEKHKNYLANINDKYWRLICKECTNGNVLQRCKNKHRYYDSYGRPCRYRGRRCDNSDVGIISLKSERPRYVCLNHDDDIIAATPQCDICSVSKPSINWFNTGLRDCKRCKKKVCKRCNENGSHHAVCHKVKSNHHIGSQCKEVKNEIDLMYNNVVIRDDDWAKYKMCGGNNPKKSSRKRMKNKRKCKSYWKQQNDKEGNVKYNKRSNRGKLFSIMLKNEM